MSDTGSRRLAAVFFSDIAGYSRQMDADEEGMLARLDIHNRILDEHVARRGGRVIKTVGDAYMVEFPSAVEAVAAGLDAQRALAIHNATVGEAERIEIRVGVHAGDVIERAGDLFGETVNQAARLEAKAPPGGLCVSAAVYEQVRKKVHATSEDLGEVALKGIEAPVRVFVLHPSGEHLETLKPSLPPPRAAPPEKTWATPARIGILIVAGVGLLYLKSREAPPAPSGVSSAAAPSSSAVAANAETPRRGGTLRLAVDRPRGSFDYFYDIPSLSSLALDLIADPLFRRSEDGSVLPGAVDRWESLEAGLAVELHLRDGLRFHDHPCFPDGVGHPATAKDLEYSLRLAAAAGALPSPLLSAAVAGDAGPAVLGQTTLRDGNTLRLQLSQAVAQPEKTILRVYLLPSVLEGCQNARKIARPVGTGPFRFAEEPKGDALRLARFEQAWDWDGPERLPWLERIELSSLSDSVEAVRRVSAGELDIFEGGSPSKDAAVELVDGVPKLRARFGSPDVAVVTQVRNDVTRIFALLFLERQQRVPGSASVRRAMAAALDPEELTLASAEGAKPLGRFLEPRLSGYDPALIGVGKRISAAERLLAAAGHPHGAGLSELTVGVSASDHAIGEKLREALAVIGVKARMVELGGELPSRVRTLELDAMVTQIAVGTFGNELAFPRLLGMFTGLGLDDDELSKLAVELQAAADPGARAASSARIERRLLEVLPAIPFGTLSPTHAASYSLVGPRVRGFADRVTARVLPASGAPYSRVYLSDGKGAR